jgi:hypothetical protein
MRILNTPKFLEGYGGMVAGGFSRVLRVDAQRQTLATETLERMLKINPSGIRQQSVNNPSGIGFLLAAHAPESSWNRRCGG